MSNCQTTRDLASCVDAVISHLPDSMETKAKTNQQKNWSQQKAGSVDKDTFWGWAEVDPSLLKILLSN